MTDLSVRAPIPLKFIPISPIGMFCLMLCLMLCLASCSSSTKELTPENDAKEIITKEQSESDSPEHILLNSAKKSYQNQLYSVAKEQFATLLNNFPTGPFSEFAEIKIADCSFYVRDYDLAAPLYEEFAKNHPGSLSSAYALLMAARSFHLSSKGVGHDAHALERAREMYSRLLEVYPDSVYRRQAAYYHKAAIDDLIANEQAVAEYYKKRGMNDAYVARLKVMEDKWQPIKENVALSINPQNEQQTPVTETEASSAPQAAIAAGAETQLNIQEFREPGIRQEEPTEKQASHQIGITREPVMKLKPAKNSNLPVPDSQPKDEKQQIKITRPLPAVGDEVD